MLNARSVCQYLDHGSANGGSFVRGLSLFLGSCASPTTSRRTNFLNSVCVPIPRPLEMSPFPSISILLIGTINSVSFFCSVESASYVFSGWYFSTV